MFTLETFDANQGKKYCAAGIRRGRGPGSRVASKKVVYACSGCERGRSTERSGNSRHCERKGRSDKGDKLHVYIISVTIWCDVTGKVLTGRCLR